MCSSANTTMVYEDAPADTFMCNECGTSFSVDHSMGTMAVEPVTDTMEFSPGIESHISFGPDGVSWCVTLEGIEVSSGSAQGYAEALDHCQTWYDRYIGIAEGDVYASAHTGSKMRIASVSGNSVSGVQLDSGALFTATAAALVGQIERGDIIRSARHDVYADVAVEGSQYQGDDGNVIEVMAKGEGMVQYADTASAASMFNEGAAKWLPVQEFYAMIDEKGYVAI